MNISCLQSKPLCLEILLTIELFIHSWYFITEAASIIDTCDLGLVTKVLRQCSSFYEWTKVSRCYNKYHIMGSFKKTIHPHIVQVARSLRLWC